MKDWKKILKNSITDSATLAKYLKIDKKEINKVVSKYPLRIKSYYCLFDSDSRHQL